MSVVYSMKSVYVSVVQHGHLPPELLTKIFTHCLGGSPVSVPPSPRSMPWVLSHVCSRWRLISLAEPRLWDHVELYNKLFPAIAFEEVMRRSGSRIVRINTIRSQTLQIISPILQRFHNSFTSLNIEVSTNTLGFLHELVLFECLERLSIHYDYHVPYYPFQVNLWKVFAPPRLHTLSVTCSDVPREFAEIGVGLECPLWSYLTDLDISNYVVTPPRVMLNILQQSTGLTNLKILLSDEHETLDPNGFGSPILVPTLRSLRLEIDEDGSNFPSRVFALLTLPSLVVLELQGGNIGTWPQQDILDFFDRSMCRLEEFQTEDYMIPLDCVVPILRALPSLVKLSIDTEEPLSDSCLQTIISDNLVPVLESLTAWVHSSNAVLELLNSRWSNSVGEGIHSGAICLASGVSDIRLEALLSAVVERDASIELNW